MGNVEDFIRAFVQGFVQGFRLSMYGKGNRSIPTPTIEPVALEFPSFRGRDYEKMTVELIVRAYRENGLHLKSKRAEVYSALCTQWLDQPLGVDQVYENRGFLILERALRMPISEAQTAGMQLYLMFAASLGVSEYPNTDVQPNWPETRRYGTHAADYGEE